MSSSNVYVHQQPPVLSQPTVIVQNQGSSLKCRKCRAPLNFTNMELQSTCKTHCCALILCLVFCPLVFVPYCTNTCKEPVNVCPHCNAKV